MTLLQEGEQPDVVIARADEAMYRAKAGEERGGCGAVMSVRSVRDSISAGCLLSPFANPDLSWHRTVGIGSRSAHSVQSVATKRTSVAARDPQEGMPSWQSRYEPAAHYWRQSWRLRSGRSVRRPRHRG